MIIRGPCLHERDMAVRAVAALGAFLAPPQFRGKGRLGLLLGRLAAQASAEAVCFPGGLPLTVDLRDRIQRLMWCGAYEPETRALFRSLVTEGSVVVDVGAHIGYFSALAGSLAGETGAVHAFEPDPGCFAALASNASHWRGIVPWNLAVSDGSGSATLFRSARRGESGWASLLDGGGAGEEVVVPTVALDEWARSEKIARIDLVKIDAEGAELRILRGAERILAEHRPAVLLEANEVCLARDGRGASDLIDRLRSHGYRVWSIDSRRGRPTGTMLALHPARHGLGVEPALPGVRLSTPRTGGRPCAG